MTPTTGRPEALLNSADSFLDLAANDSPRFRPGYLTLVAQLLAQAAERGACSWRVNELQVRLVALSPKAVA